MTCQSWLTKMNAVDCPCFTQMTSLQRSPTTTKPGLRFLVLTFQGSGLGHASAPEQRETRNEKRLSAAVRCSRLLTRDLRRKYVGVSADVYMLTTVRPEGRLQRYR